jgi:molybdopterin-synthase adenylyltransferase
VVELTDLQLRRYARQLILPDIDFQGQQRLLRSRVLIVGAGGLGVPMAQYLAGAGVGYLRIADDDLIEISNLPRQIAFSEQDIGQPKASVLARKLTEANSDAVVEPKLLRFDENSATVLLQNVDLVLDATDSLRARLDIDRATFAAGLPWIMGSAVRTFGQWGAFDAPRSLGCYHCLTADSSHVEDPGCTQLGVLGPVVALVSLRQSLLALRYLLDLDVPWGRLHISDAWEGEYAEVAMNVRHDCLLCQRVDKQGDAG